MSQIASNKAFGGYIKKFQFKVSQSSIVSYSSRLTISHPVRIPRRTLDQRQRLHPRRIGPLPRALLPCRADMQRRYRVRRPSSSLNQLARLLTRFVMGQGHGKAASSHTQRSTRLRLCSPIRPHAAQESPARTIPGISGLVRQPYTHPHRVLHALLSYCTTTSLAHPRPHTHTYKHAHAHAHTHAHTHTHARTHA